MAKSNTTPETFAPLSKLSDYEVADDSVDVRGWEVTGSSGDEIARVHDLVVDASTMQARYLVVSLYGQDTKRSPVGATPKDPVLVPVGRARIDESARRVHLDSTGAGLANLPRYHGDTIDRDYNERFKQAEAAAGFDSDRHRMTRSAEELQIGKRKVKAGEVKVQKHVETERVREPVTRMREDVTVERRPVSGEGSRRPEIGADEIRVPITEEEVVVEKRPVVKEELVVGKRQVHEKDTVEADLKRERVDVERDGRRDRYDDPSRGED